MSEQGSKSKPIQHYGRGGAGNVAPKRDTASPAPEPLTTPTLKSKMYSTGRGGTGNMAKNDFGDEARTAQDVDVPGITLPENTHHTGRGGAANLYTPTGSEALDAKTNNERVRRTSFQRGKDRAEESIKGLADKAKAAVKGGRDSNEEATS
ncbi:uncharacterized protein HMPREF1541_06953 [Cyphellophora europaea CBS 101466]|uniref:Uncharacterized protein n=1 Tax=Cyphellophora europaea (strain CBS 101466) TaxID=1220924 RepID=W2RQY7_CYPE1|nr:uncharacterized protein HMPREF1541_06953 [Cyphellophora europaea CBS 101466]ETN38911.1 hypothetical protein HMPREF1541_06953 [Cyphellophora europaea CBS 101466]